VVAVGRSEDRCSQTKALLTDGVSICLGDAVDEATAYVTNAALQHKANDDKKFCAGLVDWGQFRPPEPHVKINFPQQFSKENSIPSIAPFPIKAVVHYPFILFG